MSIADNGIERELLNSAVWMLPLLPRFIRLNNDHRKIDARLGEKATLANANSPELSSLQLSNKRII